jgi:hypothetical protein
MSWYLDSTRVFVTDYNEDWKQTIARLQPVSGPTVHQIYGYESPILKVKVTIVGQTDKDALAGYSRDAQLHTLSGPWGALDYYIENITFTPIITICQTLRSDLPTTAQVYEAGITLLYDE